MIKDSQEAKSFVSEINDLHKTASHNCWAYVVGKKGETVYCSDAGEPSGTAGKPILNALKKNNMSNTIAVVTRYFGGVKLGVRGLIDAYGGVADRCIQLADKIEIIDYFYYKIQVDYSFIDQLKYKLNMEGVIFKDCGFSQNILLTLQIHEDINPKIINILDDLQNNKKLFYQLISLK